MIFECILYILNMNKWSFSPVNSRLHASFTLRENDFSLQWSNYFKVYICFPSVKADVTAGLAIAYRAGVSNPAPAEISLFCCFQKTGVYLNIMKLKENRKRVKKDTCIIGTSQQTHIRSKFYSYLDIHTDGSKVEEDRVGIGIYTNIWVKWDMDNSGRKYYSTQKSINSMHRV